MARILVTGASGLLGSNLVLRLHGSHQVVAASQRHKTRIPGVSSCVVDLADLGEASQLVKDVAPEWIIHCAAATDVDACQVDPEWAFRLNCDAAGTMAGEAREASFAYISTDAVFDGDHGGYTEDDPPAPINTYGQSKLAGERAVLAVQPRALIIRTNIFGWNALPKQSLAEWFLARGEAGIRSPGWTDVASTPILVNDLAELLVSLLEGGEAGIYHLGGGTCLTKFEFGQEVLSAFDLDPVLVTPATVEDGAVRAPRGRNLCLRGAKAVRTLGRRLPDLTACLSRWRRLRDEGWVDRLRDTVVAA